MRSALVLLALMGPTLVAPPALAADLGGAKAAGQVGERPDGYVGLVESNAPAEVKALVEDVNRRRRAKYSEVAQKNGIPVEAVAARAGAKLTERVPAGQYVMDASGRWVRR
jgi:uncharacterized protein YdbL (DUF1318 family)